MQPCPEHPELWQWAGKLEKSLSYIGPAVLDTDRRLCSLDEQFSQYSLCLDARTFSQGLVWMRDLCPVNTGWSDVTVIYGDTIISMLWGNTAYCVKLSGEDLSRYSNKNESYGARKCLYYHYLTKKMKSQ